MGKKQAIIKIEEEIESIKTNGVVAAAALTNANIPINSTSEEKTTVLESSEEKMPRTKTPKRSGVVVVSTPGSGTVPSPVPRKLTPGQLRKKQEAAEKKAALEAEKQAKKDEILKKKEIEKRAKEVERLEKEREKKLKDLEKEKEKKEKEEEREKKESEEGRDPQEKEEE